MREYSTEQYNIMLEDEKHCGNKCDGHHRIKIDDKMEHRCSIFNCKIKGDKHLVDDVIICQISRCGDCIAKYEYANAKDVRLF